MKVCVHAFTKFILYMYMYIFLHCVCDIWIFWTITPKLFTNYNFFFYDSTFKTLFEKIVILIKYQFIKLIKLQYLQFPMHYTLS